jgi:ketosteroid isomerase-like protein
MSHLDHIRSYYEALNTGDADLVASHFTDDAVTTTRGWGRIAGARSPRTLSGA